MADKSTMQHIWRYGVETKGQIPGKSSGEYFSQVISLSWKDAADLEITCFYTAPLSSTLPLDMD